MIRSFFLEIDLEKSRVQFASLSIIIQSMRMCLTFSKHAPHASLPNSSIYSSPKKIEKPVVAFDFSLPQKLLSPETFLCRLVCVSISMKFTKAWTFWQGKSIKQFPFLLSPPPRYVSLTLFLLHRNNISSENRTQIFKALVGEHIETR